MNFLVSICEKPKNSFKMFYWNFFFGYYPIAILQGVLALFGIGTVSFNEELLVGVGGFFVPVLIAPLVVLILTSAVWTFFTLGHNIILIILKLNMLIKK